MFGYIAQQIEEAIIKYKMHIRQDKNDIIKRDLDSKRRRKIYL